MIARLLVAVSRRWPPHRYFDPARDTFVETRYREAGPFVDALDTAVPLAGMTVMDLGCGEGGFSRALAERGPALVVATDLVPAMLDRGCAALAGHGLPVVFVAQDAGRMAVRDESIGAILTVATFEHFPDPGAVLAECRRVLVPGGVLFAQFEPYYGPTGGHLFDFIGLPWVHLLLPERTTLAAWNELSASNPALAAYNFTVVRRAGRLERAYLNRITVRAFERLVRASGFEVVRLDVQYVKGLHRSMLTRTLVRPLREVATAHIVAVLRKPADTKGRP